MNLKNKRLLIPVFILLLCLLCSGCGLSAANARLFTAEPVTTDNGDGTSRYQLSSAGLQFLYPTSWKVEAQSVNATIALYPPEQAEGKTISAAITIVGYDKGMAIKDHIDTAVKKLEEGKLENLSFSEQKVLSDTSGLISYTVDYEGIPTRESYTFNLLGEEKMALCGITAPTEDYDGYRDELELILYSIEPYASPETSAQGQ